MHIFKAGAFPRPAMAGPVDLRECVSHRQRERKPSIAAGLLQIVANGVRDLKARTHLHRSLRKPTAVHRARHHQLSLMFLVCSPVSGLKIRYRTGVITGSTGLPSRSGPEFAGYGFAS